MKRLRPYIGKPAHIQFNGSPLCLCQHIARGAGIGSVCETRSIAEAKRIVDTIRSKFPQARVAVHPGPCAETQRIQREKRETTEADRANWKAKYEGLQALYSLKAAEHIRAAETDTLGAEVFRDYADRWASGTWEDSGG